MNTLKVKFYHSHKKQKDSLETRTILSIFTLEIEISGVADVVAVVTMVPTLQFRRSLQIKR